MMFNIPCHDGNQNGIAAAQKRTSQLIFSTSAYTAVILNLGYHSVMDIVQTASYGNRLAVTVSSNEYYSY